MRRIHQDEEAREEFMLDLDEIAREGARRMLAEALRAEVEAYVEAAKGERDVRGHALVTRNGYAREREVLLGAGSVAVRAPRVDDRKFSEGGERRRFREKGETGPGWINGGVYVLEPGILDFIPTDRVVSAERETFPLVLEQNHYIFDYRVGGFFVDIGTPQGYRRFCQYVEEGVR